MSSFTTSEGRVEKFNEQLNLIKTGLTKTVKQHKEMGVRGKKLQDNIENSLKHEVSHNCFVWWCGGECSLLHYSSQRFSCVLLSHTPNTLTSFFSLFAIDSLIVQPYADLQVALRAVSNSLAEIEREREKAITTRMQVSVVGKLNNMETLLKKPINKANKDLTTCRKKVKKEDNKTTINETVLQDAKLALEASKKEFFTALPAFEEHRVDSIKSLLSEYCNSLMYYHCKSIEQLSTAMAALGKVDSKAARKQCEKEMKKEGVKITRE